jgi:hypothetical protein
MPSDSPKQETPAPVEGQPAPAPSKHKRTVWIVILSVIGALIVLFGVGVGGYFIGANAHGPGRMPQGQFQMQQLPDGNRDQRQQLPDANGNQHQQLPGQPASPPAQQNPPQSSK